MRKLYIIISMLILSSAGVSAQNLKSTFFSPKNPHRHEYNPALTPGSSYFAIPVTGNLSLGVQSNLKLSSLLYPAGDGTLNTFLSPAVSNEEFNSKIGDLVRLNAYVSSDILSMGFADDKSFTSFHVRAIANTSLGLPTDIFRFLKNGMSGTGTSSYNLNDFGASGKGLIEVALGHSGELFIPNLRFGVKAKFNIGILNADIRYDELNISLSEDLWQINSTGTVNSSGIEPVYDENGTITGVGDIFPEINGFGVTIDVGASYTLFSDLELSLSVMNIGFMNWKNTYEARTNGESFDFTGFNDIDLFGGYSFDEQIEELGNDLTDALINFYEYKSGITTSSRMKPMINAGAMFDMPESNLQFGVLLTTEFTDLYNWVDIMGSVNYRPNDWFNWGFNGSLSNMGRTFGTLIDFNFSWVNIFCGFNFMSLRFTDGDLMLPLNGTTYQLNTGLSFRF